MATYLKIGKKVINRDRIDSVNLETWEHTLLVRISGDTLTFKGDEAESLRHYFTGNMPNLREGYLLDGSRVIELTPAPAQQQLVGDAACDKEWSPESIDRLADDVNAYDSAKKGPESDPWADEKKGSPLEERTPRGAEMAILAAERQSAPRVNARTV